jgi:hypothetical protein
MIGSAHHPFTRLGLAVGTRKFHRFIRGEKDLFEKVTTLHASELKNGHVASSKEQV